MKLNALQIELSLLLLFAAAPCARPQSTFVNLDFESARIIPDTGSSYYPYAVAVSNGIPGWTAYGGTFLGSAGQDIIYDTLSLGAAAISIHDINDPFWLLQGNYTVLIQGSFPGGAIVPAMGQTGTIPADARSIRYYGQAPCTVTFGGQPVPIYAVGSGPNYTIFGGDVSAFANQTAELKFQGGGMLDNIFFSNEAIPEPSLAALLLLGALALGFKPWVRS